MASKSAQQEPEKAEVIEELLDALDTTLDRVKVLYEQFFLGIQKQPPTYLHTDVERKLRDLAQLQIRNTALRYRFATLQQKFGSYNSYWRRTLRQIENGTYARNLSKVGRQAAKTGAAVPEEILAAMPKRMREQVIRDREAALALARLRERQAEDEGLLTLADEAVDVDVGDLELDEDHAFISESSDVRRNALTATGSLRVDEADADFDVDAFFASVIREDTDPEIKPPPPADAAEPAVRGSRPGSRPPALSRTRTGHPAPAALSGQRDAAVPTGNRLSSPGLPAAEPAASSPSAPSVPARSAASPSAASASTRSAASSSPGLAAPQSAPSSATSASAQASSLASAPAQAAPSSVARDSAQAASPDAAAASAGGGSQRAARPAPEIDATSAPVESPAAAAASRPADGGMGRRVGIPVIPQPPTAAKPAGSQPTVARPDPANAAKPAPSQATRPLRIEPGAAAARAPVAVETLAGPFPRIPSPPSSLTSTRGAAAGAVPEPITDPPPSPNVVPAEAAAPPRRATPPAGVPVRSPEAAAPSSPRATPPAVEPSRSSDAAAANRRATPAAGVPVRSAEAATSSSSRATPPAVEPSRSPDAAAANRRATPPAGVPVRSAEAATPSRARATAPAVEPPRPADPAGANRPATPAAGVPVRPDAAAPSSPRATPPAGEPSRPAGAAPSSRRTPPPERAPSGERPRPRTPTPRPEPEPRPPPPPGMSDADVNALYAKYVKAKQILGEEAEPGTYGKLLKTINAQAPKIMEQYKSKGVDFSVVVKDNQVIIRAKPKP